MFLFSFSCGSDRTALTMSPKSRKTTGWKTMHSYNQLGYFSSVPMPLILSIT